MIEKFVDLSKIGLGVPEKKIVNCTSGFIDGVPLKYERMNFTCNPSTDINMQAEEFYDELWAILYNYKYVYW